MRYSDFNRNHYHDWNYISELWENFESIKDNNISSYEMKKLAAMYLGKSLDRNLSKYELRHLFAKAKKIKTHSKKEVRSRAVKLAKEIQTVYNGT